MSRTPPLPRRLGTLARWPAGIALTCWHYMWRTTPIYRRELLGSWEEDGPPPVPPARTPEDLQRLEDGFGPLLHRRYLARIEGASMEALELVAALKADPNRAAPTEFAHFTKVRGEDGAMALGDEYVVRMPGHWDGPVSVVDVAPGSFRLATLAGHLEAGQIEFRASDEDGRLAFCIESWARSGDRLSKLLYERVRMAKEVQLHMWTSYLERVVELSGGGRSGALDIDTRRVEEMRDGG